MLRLTAIFHLLLFGTQLCISKQAKFDVVHESLVEFQLRHYHTITADAQILFHDAPEDLSDSIRLPLSPNPSYTIKTKRTTSHKPQSYEDYLYARSLSIQGEPYREIQWAEDDIIAPDVENRQTLLELAKMTNNAYLEPGEAGWYELSGEWNVSYPFGWEPDQDGFRGHVFATPDNSTVVLAIKGTSASFIGGGGPTSKKDKINDNLLFSCCCARIDWTWTTVCDCYRGGWKCDQSCLEKALIDDSLFYPIGTNLYNNITYMYPDSNIWIIGHSLGGALASLIGITFGAPAVTFESPGERMAAGRLHVLLPPSTQHVTHVYHTADPIAMGTCNGVLSSCALGGYAMESKCHLGKSIVYDTVSNLSWAVDIRTHTIGTVIEKLLTDPWAPSEDLGREVPEPVAEDDCVECYSWEFGDFPPTKKIQGDVMLNNRTSAFSNKCTRDF
ncbi:hypothetical protein QCA50_005548 [Cerrena zonata]|uniref:triacylglycerol lipase n=1 Tax=Cerrena zonata TaxID=2478898 RepID=A0AAW0GAQ7_9APHY